MAWVKDPDSHEWYEDGEIEQTFEEAESDANTRADTEVDRMREDNN